MAPQSWTKTEVLHRRTVLLTLSHTRGLGLDSIVHQKEGVSRNLVLFLLDARLLSHL